MKTLSIETLRTHKACDLDRRVRDLQTTLGRVVPETEGISLETWFGLDSTTLGDALWVTCVVFEKTDVAVEVARLAAKRTGCPRAAHDAALAARFNAEPYWVADDADDACAAATISAARDACADADYAAADAELTAQWNDLYRLLDLETR